MPVGDLGPIRDLAKRLTTLESQMKGLQTRDVLQNASIGLNGLTVNDGGGILIDGGGSMHVQGGGSVEVDGGGTLFVNGIDISTIIGQSILPRVGGTSTAGFLVPLAYSGIISFNFVVPAGYTRATITATGFLSGSSGSTGGERIFGRLTINGNVGPESIQVWTVNEVAANVVATHSLTLSGLVTGQVLSVLLEGHLQFGPAANLFSTFNNANVVGSAMFLV